MLQPYLCWLFLLFCLCMPCGRCQWTEIINGSLVMPGHVYEVECTVNSVVSGVVSWVGSGTDLDLYVYQEGRNLMSRSQPFAIFESYSLDFRERFSINVNPGKYYLRIFAYSLARPQDYDISISQTGHAPVVYSGYFRSESKYMTAVHLNNQRQSRNIPIKYSISGASGISIMVVSSSRPNIYYYTSPGSVICFPSDFSNGDWSLIFNHTLNNLYTLTPYSYSFSISLNSSQCNNDNSCDRSSVWNVQSQSCIGIQHENINYVEPTASADTSFSNMVKIVMISIGSAGAFFILLGFIVCLVKARKTNRKNIIHPLEVVEIEEQYSNQNLQQQTKDTCSICLDSYCNAYLPCHHWFHYKCISEWYDRNKICPMCRKSFTGLKIIKRQEIEIQDC